MFKFRRVRSSEDGFCPSPGISGGTNPLDMTGVHPETYPVVERMLAATSRPITEVMGRSDVLKSLKPEAFADEKFGAITIKDILQADKYPQAVKDEQRRLRVGAAIGPGPDRHERTAARPW